MKHESRPEAAIGDLLAGDQVKDTAGGALDTAAMFRGAYAVLVRGRLVRRHLYLNLPAAERAVRPALDRGAAAAGAAEVVIGDE